MKKSAKITYCCQSCGYQAPKWMGKCPDCGTWDSIVEERTTLRDTGRKKSNRHPVPVAIDSIELETESRLLTHIQELDRALGGGLVPGTLILVGGDPGIGKSTLMRYTDWPIRATKFCMCPARSPSNRSVYEANVWERLPQV
jgi:DNA repair protein RadA/Sms